MSTTSDRRAPHAARIPFDAMVEVGGALGPSFEARAVNLSPAYVTTALKKSTGRSAVQWIITSRMAEARRLLLHSDEHVDIIAERVGYADSTHFIRMFRREHGVTPAAWRAKQLR